MLEVAQRVTDLEATLERFISHTDQMLADMKTEAAAQVRRHDQMLADMKTEAAAQVQRHDRMLAEMKVESAAEANWHRRTIAEIKAEGAQFRREINKQWSDLAKKMGTIVEDIVAPNVPRIAREHFGLALIERFGIRMRVRHPVERGREREFDVICAGSTAVIWTDVKATARQEYVEAFVAALPQFPEFFPEYRDHELIPVFASFHLPPDQLRYLTGKGVSGLAMGEETMELVNLTELQARR